MAARRRLLQAVWQLSSEIPGASAQSAPLGQLQQWARHSPTLLGSRLTMPKSFASKAAEPDRQATTDAVLQQVQVHKLRDELQDEADERQYITFEDFAARAKRSGAAQSDADAEELCRAMQRSGILLRHHNLVYLDAHDIQEMVMVLPGGKEDAQARLTRVEEEILQLDKVHTSVHRAAARRTDLLLTAGGMVLFAQFVGFIYLTWWELSWDVMEPFGYIIQLFYSVLAYVYFMATRGQVFDLGPFRDFWRSRIKAKKIQKIQFDEGRYDYLLRLRNRYKQHLAHVPTRI